MLLLHKFIKCDKIDEIPYNQPVVSCSVRVVIKFIWEKINLFCATTTLRLNSDRYYWQFSKIPRFSFEKYGYDNIDKRSENTDICGFEHKDNSIPFYENY